MGCGCKSKKGKDNFKGLDIRDSKWTKKLITETLYVYNEVLTNRYPSLEEWGIIFKIHNEIFTNSTITDTMNIKFRALVKHNLNNFYKDFLVIKENYEQRKTK